MFKEDEYKREVERLSEKKLIQDPHVVGLVGTVVANLRLPVKRGGYVLFDTSQDIRHLCLSSPQP
jgi:hypothetical protein